MLQGKLLSHGVVPLAELLVHTKGSAVAHQNFNGFHNLWFRRSYINLLCFCLCLTRAVSITEVILATTRQFSYCCSRTFGGQKEENVALCVCRSRPAAEQEYYRKKKQEWFEQGMLDGLPQRLEACPYLVILFQGVR